MRVWRIGAAVIAAAWATAAAAQDTPAADKSPEQLRFEALELRQKMVEAQAAIAEARGGVIAAPPEPGGVTAEAGAAKPEALVLASLQLRRAAAAIVSALPANRAAGSIYVTSDAAFPDLLDLQVYGIRRRGLLAQLNAAKETATAIEAYAPARSNLRDIQYMSGFLERSGAEAALPAFPSGIAVVTQLASAALSWFKTDYSVAGVDVEGAATGDLVDAVLWAGGGRIQPLSTGVIEEKSIETLFTDFQALSDARKPLEKARQRCVLWREEMEVAVEAAPAAGKAAARAPYQQRLLMCLNLDPAIAAYDAFLSDYGAGTQDKLLTVLKQLDLRRRLADGAHLLSVRLSAVEGATFTQSNVFATLGGMPFHVTTATAVDWRLTGSDGGYVAGDRIQLYDGYRRLQEVDKLVNGCNAVAEQRRRQRTNPPPPACTPPAALARPAWVEATRRAPPVRPAPPTVGG